MPGYKLYCVCAAALAVQAGVFSSSAAEDDSANSIITGEDGFGQLGFPGFMGSSGSFLDIERSIAESLNSFMSAFGSMQHIMPSSGMMYPTAPSLALSLLKDEDGKSCQVEITMRDNVHPEEVKVGLHTSGGRVTVAYHSQAVKEQNDPEKGNRRSSSSVQVSSSLGLPERCLATTTVLLTSSAGYLLESEAQAEQPHRGRIVFPSKELLAEYASRDLLPADIEAVLVAGDKQRLDELTPLQRCLAAGFTEADCEKLGNRKPDVVSVVPFVGATDVVPIPRYDANLEVLY